MQWEFCYICYCIYAWQWQNAENIAWQFKKATNHIYIYTAIKIGLYTTHHYDR